MYQSYFGSTYLDKSGSYTEDADSLDDYMSSLGTSMDKTTRTQIRRKVFELKKVLDASSTIMQLIT